MQDAHRGILPVAFRKLGERGQGFGVLRLMDEIKGLVDGFAILRRELLEGSGEGVKVELRFGRFGGAEHCGAEESGEDESGWVRHLSSVAACETLVSK